MSRIDILVDVVMNMQDFLKARKQGPEEVFEDFEYQVLTVLEDALQDYGARELMESMPEEVVFSAYRTASWCDQEPFRTFCRIVEETFGHEI